MVGFYVCHASKSHRLEAVQCLVPNVDAWSERAYAINIIYAQWDNSMY